MKQAVILFPEIGPYHVARISALRDSLMAVGIELHAFRFAANSNDYRWAPQEPASTPTITLLDHPPKNPLTHLILGIRFFRAISNLKVDYAYLPSYYPLPNLLCLLAAKMCGCRTILMSESWAETSNSSLLALLSKRFLVSLFDSALVGGTPQARYYQSLGMSPSSIFHGYDVIDVDYFSRASRTSDSTTSALRALLPKRYFLSLGRLVKKKNLETLLQAFSLYVDYSNLKSYSPLSLVIVGDGPLEQALKRQAYSLGLRVREYLDQRSCGDLPEVVFIPFQQINLTPYFYSWSEAFILPSHYEEWGLVVNEAMACRTAVIVSSKAGSCFDLIEDDVTGLVFQPSSSEQLAYLLARFDEEANLRDRLAQSGFMRIKDWTPSWFASQAANALAAAIR